MPTKKMPGYVRISGSRAKTAERRKRFGHEDHAFHIVGSGSHLSIVACDEYFPC